jgi:hypothetical protein
MMPSRIVHARRALVGARWGALAGVALALVSAEARADVQGGARSDQPSVISAFLTGAVLAGASLGIGGAIAVGAESDQAKAVGIYGAQAGLVVAPFAAHAMLGEYRRGIFFAVPSLAATLGMTAILQMRPHTVAGGPAAYQYAFSTLMTVSVFSAMLGVSDVLSFRDRSGNGSVAILPDVNHEQIGVRIGGKL